MTGLDRERREMVLRAAAIRKQRKAADGRSARRATAMRAAAALRWAASADQRNAESS